MLDIISMNACREQDQITKYKDLCVGMDAMQPIVMDPIKLFVGLYLITYISPPSISFYSIP